MTDLLDSVVAVLVAGVINVLIVVALGARAGPQESPFLTRVYAVTLLIRTGLALGLNASVGDSAVGALFWGDSGTYDGAADLLARRWQGEATGTAAQTQALSGYGFVYYVAAIYFVFGRNQLLVQLLNATIGSMTAIVVYGIASRLFGVVVARRAAVFMAFFPQMLFWSAGMYKDPAVLLCIALSMYAVVRLRERFSPGMAVLLGGAAVGLLALRFYVFYFVAMATLLTFVFGRRGSFVSRLPSYVLVVAVLAGVFTFVVKQETLQVQRAFMTLDQLQVTRLDQAMWGKSAYGAGYDVSTPAGAIQALPIGLVYLLFAPFPWAITGVRQLLTLPETLVWYALMPAFVRGLAHSVRHRLRDVLPILVFMVTLTVAYALMQGNVGTAYRQRTQVTMFFFVFMGVGLAMKHRRSVVATQAAAGPQASGAALEVGTRHTEGTVDHDRVYPLEDHDFVYPDDPDPVPRA